MSDMNPGAGSVNYSVQRADELFEQHRRKAFSRTDRLFAQLTFVEWPVGILIAIFGSSEKWMIGVAAFVGGVLSILPICAAAIWPGRVGTRHVVAGAQMLMSAWLVALMGGRGEAHFLVFGSLLILSFYRDWRVLVTATIVMTASNLLLGIWSPYSVTYGALSASALLLTVECAGGVIFAGVLIASCRLSEWEMRRIANGAAALEASEQDFRRFFEEASIGMALIGLDESFKKVNATLCQMLGYSEGELTRRTTTEITFEDDILQGKQDAEELLTGLPRSSMERRYVRKNGDILWITRTAWLMRDVDGAPRHFLIMVEDISERKRSEEALCESKRQLEAAHHAKQLIMDHSQDVICTIDEAGRFISVNAACEQLWGYKPAELLGRHYMELVYRDDRAMTNQVSDVLRLDGKITDFVNRCIRKDGTLVDVLWSASWSASDKITFGVAHDITERARIEKELREAKDEADRANRAKSEFLSRMSHELRTPLNAILGFSQLLERQNPTGIQRPRINHIITAGRHLLHLINEVLDISRVDTDNLPLALEPVSVAEALEDALKLIRPLAAQRGIALLIPTPEENFHVMADRQRLTQVLVNLVTNAVKYTPLDGKVTVFFTTIGAGNLRIAIRDTGPGILPEKQDRLFTPFDRLGAEQTEVQGTGLGLALCQRLMDAMHGSIGFNTSVGHGSTFWVELARAEPPLHGVASETPEGVSLLSDVEGKKRTILYIEDNVPNVAVVQQMLADQADIKLITAMKGLVGIEMARKQLPDLILLDLHLPDLHGRDVLARLRRDKVTCEIPVIIISADVTPGQAKRLKAEGAYEYLTKPFDMQEFFRVINETAVSRLSDASVAA